MKKFLTKHGKEVEWLTEPEALGQLSLRVSRHSAAEWEIRENTLVIIQEEGPGRKADFEWDCRFCKEQLRTQASVIDHWTKSHMKEGTFS